MHPLLDDLFEKETQPVSSSKRAQPAASHENSEGQETNIFDVATQMMTEAVPAPVPAPVKRISMVASQSQCEPVNTPPWSMAARLTNEAIEQYEKQKQAEREAAKQKVRKRRYLFATSDEDDDSESDLEFDLAKPAERMLAIKENVSEDSVEEIHSNDSAKKQSHQVHQQQPTKKQKTNDENINVAQQQPAKRNLRQFSVKVSRDEVEKELRNRNNAGKPKESTKSNEAKGDKTKPTKSAQQKDSYPKEDVRKSKRTKKLVTHDSPPAPAAREKNQQKNDKVRAGTPNQIRNTRSANKSKTDGDDKRTNAEQPPIIGTVSKTMLSHIEYHSFSAQNHSIFIS